MSRQESNFNHCAAQNLNAKPLIQGQKKKSKKQRKKQLESTKETNETEVKATMLQPAKLTNCTVSKQTQISALNNDAAEVQIPSQQEKKKLKKLRQKEKKLAAKGAATLNGECTAATSSAASSNGIACTGTASLGKITGAIPKEKPKRPADVQKPDSEILLSKKQQKKLQRSQEEQIDKKLNKAKNCEINIAKMPINTKEKDTSEKSKNLQNSKPISKKKKRQTQKQELEKEHLEVQKTLSFQRPPAQPKTFAMHKPPRKSTLLKPLVFDVTAGETLTWAREFQQLVRSELHCNAQTAPFYKIGRHFGMHATRTDDDVIKELFKKFLEEKKAGHFTYTPKEELRVLLVLKRPSTFEQCSAKDVKDALQHLGVPLLRVEDFKSMWKPDHSYGRYLVEVSRDVDLEILYNQTNLLEHENWKWSKLKKPAISQCRNCQRYGHVANNCRMPFRCVKCKEPHDPGKCPRSWIKDGVKNVYCHNCKKNGHPSNYRGCPAYKQRCEALERQRANSNFSALIKKVVHSVNKALQKNKVLLTQRN